METYLEIHFIGIPKEMSLDYLRGRSRRLDRLLRRAAVTRERRELAG